MSPAVGSSRTPPKLSELQVHFARAFRGEIATPKDDTRRALGIHIGPSCGAAAGAEVEFIMVRRCHWCVHALFDTTRSMGTLYSNTVKLGHKPWLCAMSRHPLLCFCRSNFSLVVLCLRKVVRNVATWARLRACCVLSIAPHH